MVAKLTADRLPDGSVKLWLTLHGERCELSSDQTAFCLTALGIGLRGKPVRLTKEYRPVVDGFTLDGEEIARRLHWSEDRVKLVATELAELGIVHGITTEQPE